MKAALLALWALIKTPLVGLLQSKKVWTTILGTIATMFGAWLAKHGFDLSDKHVEYVAGVIATFVTVLLAGQAAQDHGKERAKVETEMVAKASQGSSSPTPEDADTGEHHVS